MKKLTKSNTKISNTMEAFGCGCTCSCYEICYCVAASSTAGNDNRDNDIKNYRIDSGTGYGNY